jgi:hypothetical protein
MAKLSGDEFAYLTALIRSNPNRNWDNFAKAIEGKTPDEVMKMVKENNNG